MSGSGFRQGSLCSFAAGRKAATALGGVSTGGFVSSTLLRCEAPAMAAGLASIAVVLDTEIVAAQMDGDPVVLTAFSAAGGAGTSNALQLRYTGVLRAWCCRVRCNFLVY